MWARFCGTLFCLWVASIGVGFQSVSARASEFLTGSHVVDGAGTGTKPDPWFVAGLLHIGWAADGDLTVKSGGSVAVSGLTLVGSGGSGQFNITGHETNVSVTGALLAGWLTAGDIIILNGGSLSNESAFLGNGGVATVNVDGVGSAWYTTDILSIGSTEKGSLSIANGGSVFSGYTVVGDDPLATGAVTVGGVGSHWLINDDFDIGGSGTGNLRVDNGGTVTSGLSSIGYFAGSNGSVGLTGGGTSWSVNGGLTIGYGSGGPSSGALTVNDGAVLSVDGGDGVITLGKEAGSQGTLILGAEYGSAASGSGSINATELIFGSGAGELIFNHTDQNHDWSLNITGSGTIRNVAGITHLTGDMSGFSGTTIVSGGLLRTDGNLAGSLLVDDGGTLGGGGTFSNVVLASGATVAPGNSIGTMNIVGSLDFISGTTYEVEVDGLGNSDLIVSTGAISIDTGSTLFVLAENGMDTGATYQPITTYTILQGASLTGSFGTITENFAYLDAGVTYDAANAYLTLTRADDLLFQSRAITTNQKSVATAISSQGDGPLFHAILLLPDDAPPAAFDALSGEIHGDVVTGVLNQGSIIRNILLGRAPTGSGDAESAQSARDSGFLPYERSLGALLDTSTTFWTTALGSAGEVDGDGNSYGLATATNGLMIGADRELGEGWYGGIAAGLNTEKISQDNLISDANVESYHLAAHGGRRIGPLGVSLGAVETWSGVETNRQIQFSGFSDEVSAKYWSGMIQVYLEAGWSMNGDLWTVEPFGNIAFSHIWRGPFIETGGAAALEAPSSNDNNWQTTVGLRIDRDFAINDRPGTTHATIGWTHTVGQSTVETETAFAGGGDTFHIASSGLAGDTAFLQFGAQLNIAPLASVSFEYISYLSGGSRSEGLSTHLEIRF